MTVVSLEQRYPGHAAQVLALAAQVPGGAYFTKWIIAVDEDVDPTDMDQVIWAMATRCNPGDDIELLRNTWSTTLDPAQNPPEKRLFGSKAMINACKDYRHLKTFSRRTTLRKSVYDRVSARWTRDGAAGTRAGRACLRDGKRPAEAVTLDHGADAVRRTHRRSLSRVLAAPVLTPSPGEAIVVCTVDADGWPHPAMLSYFEVAALDPRTLRLAVYNDSRTCANMRERGAATLILADPGPGVLRARRASRRAGAGHARRVLQREARLHIDHVVFDEPPPDLEPGRS